MKPDMEKDEMFVFCIGTVVFKLFFQKGKFFLKKEKKNNKLTPKA